MGFLPNDNGGGGGGGTTISVVANYASLPAAGSVSGGFRWVQASTGIHLTGLYYSNGVSWEFNPADDITVVANYSALPAVGTVTGQFYWCSASQGTAWLPGSLGGTYYSAGLYYSNGVSWEFLSVPYNATQAEVHTGTNNDKFVTPATLTGEKDATGGIAGLTLFKINFKNAANTFTSFFTNTNTASRTYTFPDRDLTFSVGRSVLTSGTTFTTPTDISINTLFKITLCGGGGGGGGINTANLKATGGGGGGALTVWLTGLAPSTNYTYAIGAGGTAGTAAPSAGGNGGTTTITINSITYTGTGGTGGPGAGSSEGGAGGTGTNGDINITGERGGASGSSSGAVCSGRGGMPAFGLGTGGAERNTAGNGYDGNGYGAGGSGASGAGGTGGAGTGGIIIIEWHN